MSIFNMTTSNEATNVVRDFVTSILSTLGGIKGVLALIGLSIVFIVLLVYMGYGFYKFIRFSLRLRPHEFALAILVLGFALIVVAILIPF